MTNPSSANLKPIALVLLLSNLPPIQHQKQDCTHSCSNMEPLFLYLSPVLWPICQLLV